MGSFHHFELLIQINLICYTKYFDICMNNFTELYFNSVIEQLGGKHVVMGLLAHEESEVRYEALLSVQKLMVHNWYWSLI